MEARTVDAMLVEGDAVGPITKPEPGDTSPRSGPARDVEQASATPEQAIANAGTGVRGRCDSYTRLG
jgi:hypothetical protein